MSSLAVNSAQETERQKLFDLKQEDFAEISSMVYAACGINVTSAKFGLVASRLQKRIRALKLGGFTDYVRYLKSKQGDVEMAEMISSITTNVTSFNRESHHFDHFRNQVLPKLIDAASRGEPVRLWSAGCSDGREPYTLACTIYDAFPNVGNSNFRILATDIDKYSLEKASSGEYSGEMVSKLTGAAQDRHFDKNGTLFKVKKHIRDMVQFNALNLMAPWPMTKKFDAIFCRNVLIYFTSEDQARLLVNFTRCLKPRSHLYIGHSERVDGPAASVLNPVGVTTYRFEPEGNLQ